MVVCYKHCYVLSHVANLFYCVVFWTSYSTDKCLARHPMYGEIFTKFTNFSSHGKFLEIYLVFLAPLQPYK